MDIIRYVWSGLLHEKYMPSFKMHELLFDLQYSPVVFIWLDTKYAETAGARERIQSSEDFL